MTKLYNDSHMPSGEYRRLFGPLWIHMSETELGWVIAAAVSVGILIGIAIALAAVAMGGTL